MVEDLQRLIDDGLAGTPMGKADLKDVVHTSPKGEVVHGAEILQRLPERTPAPQGKRLHVGVGGFFNFEMAARSRPNAMLLLDINRNQETFWREIISILAEAPTPAAFREGLLRATHSTDEHTGPKLFPRDGGEPVPLKVYHFGLDAYLDSSTWMSDPKAYAHLHELAKSGRMAAASIDLFNDRARAEKLGEVIAENELVADSCYWSNVGEWSQPTRYGKVISTKDAVHGKLPKGEDPIPKGIGYDRSHFYQRQHVSSKQRWNGEEETPSGRPRAFEKLPPFERMLRNVSAIAPTGMHLLADAENKRPLMVFDGAPSRSPQQWRQRETLKRAHEAAGDQERSV